MNPEGCLRADARANRQTVIDATIDLLPSRPDASMQDIADHSGLARTTVYRHFPNRESLFAAVVDEVMLESREEISEATSSGLGAAETIRRLSDVMIDLGLRFRFLYENGELTLGPVRRRAQDGESSVELFLRDAQERDEIRTDMPAWWLNAMTLALWLSMVREVLAGRIVRSDAGADLAATLISLIGAA
jgi:AcrR family transcriptional regulator